MGEGKGISIDDLYSAVAQAETGEGKDLSDDSRFIRTKAATNSSAYGPVQITRNFANLFQLLHNEGVIPEDLKDYYHRFVDQGTRFLNSSGDDPNYGLGGKGDLSKEKSDYASLAKAMMGRVYQNSKGDLNEFIRRWRGESEENDPRYYRIIRKHLGRKPQTKGE